MGTFNKVLFTSETIENHVLNGTSNVTQILDMGKRRLIEYQVFENEEIGLRKMCWSSVLPDFYTPAALAFYYQALADAAVCSNSDGTYDTWKISKSFYSLASVDLDYVTTQDLLWHSMSEITKLKDEEVHEQTSVSSAEAAGPSAADLDPAQFDVECKEMTFGDFNVNLFSSKVGVFRKHVLAALRMAEQV